MIDLPKKLRIKAGVINMGGRIAWGSDTALMEEAASLIEQQQAEIAALKEELNYVTEYKDKLNTTVHVLLDQVKRGEVTLGAMYDVDVLLGD